mmetsp:Transcript_58675/g.126104  ORF Transcript_58675/g.126104 Transcript_58675/m.126104 type:complete len:269 (+) Transcript_58675:159-965(+)
MHQCCGCPPSGVWSTRSWGDERVAPRRRDANCPGPRGGAHGCEPDNANAPARSNECTAAKPPKQPAIARCSASAISSGTAPPESAATLQRCDLWPPTACRQRSLRLPGHTGELRGGAAPSPQHEAAPHRHGAVPLWTSAAPLPPAMRPGAACPPPMPPKRRNAPSPPQAPPRGNAQPRPTVPRREQPQSPSAWRLRWRWPPPQPPTHCAAPPQPPRAPLSAKPWHDWTAPSSGAKREAKPATRPRHEASQSTARLAAALPGRPQASMA